jgi:drug/metabolite transporter (DMT)-like permease
VILRPGAVPFGWASAMVLASASLYAMTTIYTRVIGRTDDAGVTTFYYQFFLMLFSAGPALWGWVMPSWHDLPAILMLGTVGTIAPYCIIRALKCAEATVTAPFDFLRMPFTTFMGFLFFGESTGIWVWIGGAIIFSATYFMTWREARAGRYG